MFHRLEFCWVSTFFSLPDYLGIPSYDYSGFPLLYRKSANLEGRGREVGRLDGGEQDRGSEKRAGRQSKAGNVNLYEKELVRKERKGGDNHEQKNVFRKQSRWENTRQKVRLEESVKKPKGGKLWKNEDHTKEKRKWTKGNVEKAEQRWHGQGGRDKGKVLTRKSLKNKNGKQRRGGKNGGRQRKNKKLSGGGKRIQSKFFQRLKVGSGKEVATVHTTQDGRKVKSCINFICLEKLNFQVSIEFRGKTYTLSLSQMRKLVDGADKGVKIAVKQKKADRSKNKIVVPRVPI